MVSGDIKGKLEEYSEKVNRFSDPSGKFKLELNTTIKFVIPLLNILGWEHLGDNMGFEYPVRSKNLDDKKRVTHCDIALYLDGKNEKPEILVEVKPIQSENFGSGRYLLRYLCPAKIRYGIYTNGRELKLLDSRTPKSYHPEGLFSLKAKDFSTYADVLWMLSKEKVSEKGFLKSFADAYHKKSGFFHWMKSPDLADFKQDKYKLRLEFARRFLSGKL